MIRWLVTAADPDGPEIVVPLVGAAVPAAVNVHRVGLTTLPVTCLTRVKVDRGV